MGEKRLRGSPSDKVIEEIYYERRQYILKFACDFLSEPSDIQDFVQETFARFCRGFAMHPNLPKGILTAYLFRIMQNLRTDILTIKKKKQKSISWEEVEQLADTEQMEEVTFSSMDLQKVVDQMDHLPDRYALFLKMKYFGDFSDEEIAGALGVKKNSLRMIHSRARARLKELCEKEGMQL